MESFALAESTMTIDDYLSITAKTNQRLYGRALLGITLATIFLVSIGVFFLSFALFDRVIGGAIIGYALGILIVSARAVLGGKSALRKAASHPDNLAWFEPRRISVSSSGIDFRNIAGRVAFTPWSMCKRWMNDDSGITIYFAAIEFMFIPSSSMSAESREFICRHLSTYAKEER